MARPREPQDETRTERAETSETDAVDEVAKERTRRPEPADRRSLIALLVLTLVVGWFRIAYVLSVEIVSPIRSDAKQYVAYGVNLSSRGVFSAAESAPFPPDSYRSPGYPFVIAGVLLVVPANAAYPAILVLQAVLSTLLVPMVHLLGRRFLSPGATWFAVGLTAISPHLTSLSSYVLTETTFAFSLLLALLLTSFALERDRPWSWAASGVVFAFAYLVNETALLLPGALAAVLLWRGRSAPGLRRLVVSLGLFLLPLVVVFAAWFARNSLVELDTKRSGSRRALAAVTHGAYPGFVHEDPRFRYFPYREDPEQPAISQSPSRMLTVLSRRVSERPLRYLTWYALEKPYHLWSWSILQGQGDVYVYPVRRSPYREWPFAALTWLVARVLHPIVVLGALVAVVRSLLGRSPKSRNPAIPAILISTLVYYTLLYGVVFVPWPRYAVALRPELYLVGAFGLAPLAESGRRRIRDWWSSGELMHDADLVAGRNLDGSESAS